MWTQNIEVNVEGIYENINILNTYICFLLVLSIDEFHVFWSRLVNNWSM